MCLNFEYTRRVISGRYITRRSYKYIWCRALNAPNWL
nr:MAG TPA: hypothetical protein [Caudoviricetes sp.]